MIKIKISNYFYLYNNLISSLDLAKILYNIILAMNEYYVEAKIVKEEGVIQLFVSNP